jgi:hypothetical protein
MILESDLCLSDTKRKLPTTIKIVLDGLKFIKPLRLVTEMIKIKMRIDQPRTRYGHLFTFAQVYF